MNEPTVVRAGLRRPRLPWGALVMPLVAVAIAAWLLWRMVPDGPVISLRTDDAEGIEAGRTPVHHRGVPIGRVEAVTLMPVSGHVTLRVRLQPGMDAFTRSGARYWVVRPELRLGQVSGLRTLVSGRYIAAEPGSGDIGSGFDLLAQAPLPGSGPGDLLLSLEARRAASLVRGSALRYRDIPIGAVESVQLTEGAGGVRVRVRVLARHRHLVRRDSVFWSRSGINVDFGLFRGLELDTDSLQNLLTGAIEMAIPEQPGPPAEPDWQFRLHEQPRPEWKRWQPALDPHSP